MSESLNCRFYYVSHATGLRRKAGREEYNVNREALTNDEVGFTARVVEYEELRETWSCSRLWEFFSIITEKIIEITVEFIDS